MFSGEVNAATAKVRVHQGERYAAVRFGRRNGFQGERQNQWLMKLTKMITVLCDYPHGTVSRRRA